MANGHSIESFVRTVLLRDLRRMTYDCGLHYLAFGAIAVGIEFLGACQDAEDFGKQGLSGRRFEQGIEDFMRPVDARYSAYNQPGSPFYLYKHLRCGMAHIMRPQGAVGFTCRSDAEKSGYRHLDLVAFGGGRQGVIMTAEGFYDDFAKACEILLTQLPSKTGPKFTDVYLPVSELPRRT